MYEEQTHGNILQRMLNRVSDKLDKRPSSLIYDAHSAAAIELQNLYIELEYLIKNSYGDTAAREYLIMLAKDRGLSPEPATKAVLKGVFTPDNIDVTGRRFNIGDMNYVVLESISSGTYKVQCETAGTDGNRYLSNMVPIEYIPGLKTAELTQLLVPGEDEEDTESFRKRYFDSFNEQSFGGNQADYIAKVKAIDGVGAVKVERVWNADISPSKMIPSETVKAWYDSFIATKGLNQEVKDWLSMVYNAASDKKLTVGGTVRVVIVDSDDYGNASDTLVENVQEIIDPEQNAGEGYGLAPIGHVVNVMSAAAVNINVETKLTFDSGYSFGSLKSRIENAIEEYLLELRQAWAESSSLIVRVSQVEASILAIKGITDISSTLLNGSADNVSLGSFEVPVLGGVTDAAG